jgi:sterol desaturase/sphingolipid hydroxylase (fatty acid hydroxylase superfamily)
MILDALAWRLCITFLAAYSAATLLTAAYDWLAPAARIERLKTTARRRSDISVVYREAAALTACNILITVPAAILVLSPLIHPRDHFSYAELWKFPLMYLLADATFYVTHRALHSGLFFDRLHRIHHRFTAPVGLAALYAHPIEVLFGNILSVMLPPIIVGVSVPVYQFWIVLSIFNTVVISHAGIKRISEYHDLHHRRLDVNFGAEAGLMDRICRTYYAAPAESRNPARHADA